MGRAAAWLLILAGCAGAEAMTLPPPPRAPSVTTAANEVGLTPGENMTFEVRLGGMVAGQAELAVGQLGAYEGHRAVVVRSRAATVGAAALIKKVVDEATTVIDMDTGRPLALETHAEKGAKAIDARATFTGNVASITFQRNTDKQPHSYKVDFGKLGVLDAHSAMAQIRGWRPSPGTTRAVYVIGGRRVWRVDLRFVGVATIGTELGNRRAVRFDGASFKARPNLGLASAKPSRTFTVWLSDDADRVPLRMAAHTELGDVTMELTSYDRP